MGMPAAMLRVFAKEVPTSSDPISPGPLVKAMAERSSTFTPALSRAWLTTGTMFCSCALDASSGTTPPKSLCTCWLAITLESRYPSLMTAAEVSSQDDSIPRMMSGIKRTVIKVRTGAVQRQI